MPKRIAKSESPVATGMPRTKRASATHSKKSPAQAATETIETTASPAATPDREVIARLAYGYWEERGYAGGSPEDDWIRAEQELLRKQ